MNNLKNQVLKRQHRQEFQTIKRIKPNRERINGRCTYDIKPGLLIAQNPEDFFDTLTPLELNFLNLMVNFSATCKFVMPSHKWIAEQLDCDPRTVQNLIDRLEACGIITPIYRHRKTSLFRFTNWLRLPEIVDRLQPWLPGIRVFAMAILNASLLLSNVKHVPGEKFSALIQDQNMIYFINHRILTECYKKPFKREKDLAYAQVSSSPLKEKRMEHHKPPTYTKPIASQTKNHQETTTGNNGKYGGSRIYDCKISQIEIDLMAKARAKSQQKIKDYKDKKMVQDPEAQPRFNDAPQAQQPRYASTFVEDPQQATDNLLAWTKSPEFEKFTALFGKEYTLKMCRNIVNSALENQLEKK